MEPVVFLDRDNTLIANDGDLGDPTAVVLLDGVPEGLMRLRNAGFRLVVVTNQGCVARGVCSEEDVDKVHHAISTLIDHEAKQQGMIDRFYYCPFHPEGSIDEYRREHSWRKPQPGMIFQAARDLGLDLTRSWMIGDQDRDIQAGSAAGCRTVRLSDVAGTGDTVRATGVAGNFSQAVDLILAGTSPSKSASSGNGDRSLAPLQIAVQDLTDVIRGQDRAGGVNRGVAITCLMLAPIPVVLGLLTLPDLNAFIAWSMATVIMLLTSLVLLLVDRT